MGDVCYLGCHAQTSLSVIRSIRSFLKNTQKLKTLLQKMCHKHVVQDGLTILVSTELH